jgi:regulator of protease activity HflC (stomatin/prohibitin superfamily)
MSASDSQPSQPIAPQLQLPNLPGAGGPPDDLRGSLPAGTPTPAARSSRPGMAGRDGLLTRMSRNSREIWNEHRILLIALSFIFLFLVAFFWRRIFVVIHSGEAGVLYRVFSGGTVTEKVYPEGLQIVAPWNRMFIYNARVQQVPDRFTVLSQDGLAIDLEISIRFRPQFHELGHLHKNIGEEYVDKVVKPEIQSQLRFVVGQYKPEEIYTSQGFIVQTAVQGALAEIGDRYILLDDLLLKAVTLPRPVAESIESKLRAQQLAQEFDYRLLTEGKEAERKKIEAQGIRDFQDTITGGGISNEFLRFKGIEATLELARSPNAKIVIIGGGEDRLPLILDGSMRSEPAGADLGGSVPAAMKASPVSGPPRR